MKTCQYRFRDGDKCQEEAQPDSEYCILHIDPPEDEDGEEFKILSELKEKKVEEKVGEGDFNFEGAKLIEANFSVITVENDLNFMDGVIKRDALFIDATMGRNASFDGIKIGGDAIFADARIGRDLSFSESEIGGLAWFNGARVGGDASFFDSKIGGDLLFIEVKVGGLAWFNRAEVNGDLRFHLAEVKGELSFKDAKFKKAGAQEEACRRARKIYEDVGNRDEADYYFYHEMEARRRQKKGTIRILELPVQYIFGYGTKWERVFITWLSVLIACALLFWIGGGVEGANSLWENIYFSVATATTVGYGDYHPKSGVYQALASVEAIFGTFMWAAFIAIFARKYMR
ncbi:MAG: potassium channel family protein [Halobacteriota archaeon]|nr:potassium channel family protein [Halobacteriota archaeon]